MARTLTPIMIGLAGLWATPAPAFDCAKAATASEKAICADPAARAADAAMAQAFAQLLAEMNPSARGAAVSAQAAWIVARDGACTDLKGPKLGACLARESETRRAFLAAEPEAGPGAPGRLAPVFRFDKGRKGRAAITLELLKYPAPATPAERAFDVAVDRMVGDLAQPEADDPQSDRYDHQRTMRLVYASPKLISAHLDAYDFQGGAHPTSYSGNINIDVSLGREAKFSDLFEGANAAKIFALCMKGVVAEKKVRMAADAPLSAPDLGQLAKDVAEQTGNLETWSFGEGKASVTYDAYAVGSYAEGAYGCDLPYGTLKPLAKPGFPWP